MSASNAIPRVVVCGAVDDGKSTLIGRLLVETGSAPLDEVASITSADGTIDYSRLTDGLIAEREQGITIDVAYRYLALAPDQRVLLADSPGHEQYTRNMAVAASSAEIAVIVVDLVQGVREQTIRHATVCYLMGVRSFVFALNKIDAFNDAVALKQAEEEARQVILMRVPQLQGSECHVRFVPMSALVGTGVTTPTAVGQPNLVDELIEAASHLDSSQTRGPMRLPVQHVIKHSSTRYYAGRLTGQSLEVGDTIAIWPSDTQAEVSDIFIGDERVPQAAAGASIAVSFTHEVDVTRGDVITMAKDESLAHASRAHLVDLVWIGDEPLDTNASYILRCGPISVPTHVPVIRYGYDLTGGTHSRVVGVQANDIARVEITCSSPLLLDPYLESRDTGGFILCDRNTGQTVAAGMSVEPLAREGDVTRHDFAVTRDVREQFNGVRGGVLWLTGLSGSGKSTVADLLESKLLKLGIRSYVLDGDSVRQTLSADLGFSPEARKENIRRVARVAQMFMDAGLIAIVSLVSPFEADRQAARALFADEDFAEVFVDTPLEVCESRDEKGLYAQARATGGTEMTGYGQRYEVPTAPEFHLDGLAPPKENARLLRDWVLARRITNS